MNTYNHWLGKLLITLLFLFTLSCDKWESSIPEVPGFQIIVNLSIETELNVAGNYIFYPQAGYGGVIVFNTGDERNKYVAYDATCPNEASREYTLLEKDAIEAGIATCPKCGSKFSLWSYGSVMKGPAKEPLKAYYVTKINEMTLKVSNW